MRSLLFAVLAASALAGPAQASQCPMMMSQIEAALTTAALDDATRAAALALLEEGRARHDAGDHAGSEARLAEAMVLLGIPAQ